MHALAPHVTVWRLVLEAATPLSIATGRSDGARDTVLATDANALPYIPASSLAGVLRALVRAADPRLEDSLFGSLGDGVARGTKSRLDVSHAHLHDSRDRPVTGLRASIDDPLLAPLTTRRNAQRQRVRIGHRGTAEDTGLFERSVLPAGHRFTVEWMLWRHGGDTAEAALLDALLDGGWLRVGGQTRTGLGALTVVRGRRRAFDLRRADDLAAFGRLPADLADPADAVLPARNADAVGGLPTGAAIRLGSLRRLRVSLRPESGFRIGGGHRSLTGGEHPNADLPMSEGRVVWAEGRGRLLDTPQALLPGSAVKGALAHRVAFHAHRLEGRWAAAATASADQDPTRSCATVRRLFGSAGDAPSPESPGGAHAGVLGFGDTWLDVGRQVRAQVRMHNHIDRFTGGVRDGLLFAGEDLHAAAAGSAEPLLTLAIAFDARRFAAAGGTDADVQALRLALEDLCAGRLALGADAAGGLGFFHGTCGWEDGGDWPAADTAAPTLTA